jgi:hypothetical protein
MFEAIVAAIRASSRRLRPLATLCLALLLSAPAHVAKSQTAADSTAAPAATPAAPPAPAAPAPGTPPPDVAQAAAAQAAGGTITAAQADSLPDSDGGWPRLIPCPSGATMILYQPQLLSWKDQRQLVAMCAVSYTPRGGTKADLGTVRLESATSTSVEERMVNLVKVDVTGMNFQSLEKAETQEVLAEIKKSLPKENVLVALDRVLAAADSSMLSAKSVKINTEPPPIFYSAKPAILVQFDGEPIFVPIEQTSLRYVVNTNWDVFQDTNTKLYLLRNDKYWVQSADLKTWEPVQKLPEGFEKLANDDNWKDVKANVPGKKISKGKMPVIFVSKTPAELILIDGSPKYEQVKPTKLRWVKNTESDLFRYDGKDKKKTYYVLLSGRWFRTDKLEKGPWTFATTDLPDDFANIPRDHGRARVLSSVPGTGEAAQAILLASIPRTAQVDAKNLKPPDVKYDGDPVFKPIPGTSVSYADNSPFDVLKVGDTYYLCFQAVWFKSSSPAGPFTVATQVPPEIYTIPADSPMQHVTYVTVIDDDEDYPTYGYTAGYVGVSIAFGCAMWGTGYYYPPYYHGGMYYPRPVAYGGGVAYNPWTGAYGGYQAAYGPYGGVARGASYNPSTGTYARGGMAWGPGGAQGYAQAYNPRTGTYASTRQGSNVYGSWGSSHVQRGDNWVNTQRVTDSHGNTKWKAQGSGGGGAAGWNTNRGSGFVGQSGSGDVYAGKDGNVYRKTDSGWQTWDKGQGWSDAGGGQGGNRPSQQPGGAGAGNRPSTQPSQRPSQSPSAGQLDRDAQARSQGARQTQNYNNYQRGGGSSSSRGGGSRGGGGGGRGGGGRRR